MVIAIMVIEELEDAQPAAATFYPPLVLSYYYVHANVFKAYACLKHSKFLKVKVLSTAPHSQVQMRPISLLTLSLLRWLDSNFPGNSLWAW